MPSLIKISMISRELHDFTTLAAGYYYHTSELPKRTSSVLIFFQHATTPFGHLIELRFTENIEALEFTEADTELHFSDSFMEHLRRRAHAI